ncbi:hypothetical protein PTKU64_80230 [Paraburkholderia terrae]|uniref:eCIS core domain-containing protein n=1 Tax=Paraburkholderia terrae TaxID=311230 RepID=A0ABN6JWF1_9BURK|nr:DUF4157 domain-containing protein [Paraburkholderia terrae]BCZ84348.1 hypothetical protein PTKU64_80230 [Paraburkholderia terrae]
MFAPHVAKGPAKANLRPRSTSVERTVPFNRLQVSRSPPANIQRKLIVGQVNDPLEHEADRIADQVMRAPEPGAAETGNPTQLNDQWTACKYDQLQRDPQAGSQAPASEVPEIVHEQLRAPGQPLDSETRAYFEPRFGFDFGTVRVHHDSRAAESARSVGALAYTVGANVVFAAGMYRPHDPGARKLLAHELVHVVQQGAASTLIVRPVSLLPDRSGCAVTSAHSMDKTATIGNAPRATSAPMDMLYRAATPADEAQAAQARQNHEAQQRNVENLLEKGRKITPDPSKGIADGDNLFRNSIELLDTGRIRLTVLSQTHDSATRRPPEYAYFDTRVDYPHVGGDYPADPAVKQGAGLAYEKQNLVGAMISNPIAGLKAQPGFMQLFTDSGLLDYDEFKQHFVHEAQHFADLHMPSYGTQGNTWLEKFETYKTEFRAFWIQPTTPAPAPKQVDGLTLASGGAIGISRQTPPFSPATEPASPWDVTITDAAGCAACTSAPQPPQPAGTSAREQASKPRPGTVKSHFKNKRQQEIFFHLAQLYTSKKFDCLYVCNAAFREAVNNYDQPASMNLVNSTRLVSLNDALVNVRPSMAADDPEIRGSLITALMNLDAIDWQFLKNRRLSAPIWDVVSTRVPATIRDGLRQLAAEPGTPNSIDIQGLLSTSNLLKPRR